MFQLQMENTNHVNSYSHIRFLLFFITIPKFFINTVLLLFSTHQYKNRKKEIFSNQRYRKVKSWLKDLVSFKNIDYVFVDKKNMINAQTLIICNQEIDLNNLYIFTNIFEDGDFVLHMNNKQKFHNLIELLDINYVSSRLPIFIKNKYSIVITVKKPEDVANNEIIRDNYLSINVLNISEKSKKYFGKTITAKFSPLIKPNSFFNFSEQALIEKISSYL